VLPYLKTNLSKTNPPPMSDSALSSATRHRRKLPRPFGFQRLITPTQNHPSPLPVLPVSAILHPPSTWQARHNASIFCAACWGDPKPQPKPRSGFGF